MRSDLHAVGFCGRPPWRECSPASEPLFAEYSFLCHQGVFRTVRSLRFLLKTEPSVCSFNTSHLYLQSSSFRSFLKVSECVLISMLFCPRRTFYSDSSCVLYNVSNHELFVNALDFFLQNSHMVRPSWFSGPMRCRAVYLEKQEFLLQGVIVTAHGLFCSFCVKRSKSPGSSDAVPHPAEASVAESDCRKRHFSSCSLFFCSHCLIYCPWTLTLQVSYLEVGTCELLLLQGLAGSEVLASIKWTFYVWRTDFDEDMVKLCLRKPKINFLFLEKGH